MTSGSGRDPAARVVGVLCNDFGELGLAMCFVQGQPFADRTTLLLPPRLADRDDGRLAVATRRFSSAQDILRVVDEEEPDAVVLLSGYLLTLHGILPRADFPGLLERLRSRCRVVTSDPFLGLVSEGRLGARFGIDFPVKSVRAPIKSARALYLELVQGGRLIRHLSTARLALEQVPHLYPFGPAGLGDQHGATRPQRISFYNPELVNADGDGAGERDGAGPSQWLFILGKEDWELQGMLHGHDRFVALVARKLDETVDAGRMPVLIGPEPLLQVLRPRLSRPDRIRLLGFLPYGAFAALMVSAEYVFYWNVVSASSLLRVTHERPFFIFHEGHLVRNVKGLRERVRAWYYQGWEPVMLDQRSRLDRHQLDAQADDLREASSRIRTALARAPAPVAVMETLLAAR